MISKIIRFIKDWTLLLALIFGFIFNRFFGYIGSTYTAIIPTLIFCMLLLSFSKLEGGNIKASRLHIILLGIQLSLGISSYYIVKNFNIDLAEGIMISILVSTATSAPVVVNLMKGKIEFITQYLLVSSVSASIFLPIWFSWIGHGSANSFWTSSTRIATYTLPTILLPLFIALLTRKFAPKVHNCIRKCTSATYYMWAFALMVLIGRAVNSFLMQDQPNYLFALIAIIAAFIICSAQLIIGKLIGRKYNESIGAGQAIAQKNTVLAIWLSCSFLSPMASLVPTMYIIAQNIINSIQIKKATK
ncbi:MAG: hypothetical protein EOL95_00240 [Bacteroidia bacterium]|nr:hypothetical protein [Bacteroidia bacterium]